jgi:hypothetical protein
MILFSEVWRTMFSRLGDWYEKGDLETDRHPFQSLLRSPSEFPVSLAAVILSQDNDPGGTTNAQISKLTAMHDNPHREGSSLDGSANCYSRN